MTKILVIGDPHFKTDNKDDTDIFEIEIRDLLLNIQPDAVVVLGDVLHNHEKINSKVFKRAIGFLNMVRTHSKKTFLIIGNHDMISNNVFLTDDHAFGAIKYWNNIVCVDKPHIENIDEFNFLFCPYVKPGLFDKALNGIELTNIKSVFAHQEFKGAQMGAIISKNGDEWNINNPLCISGHIHQYQQLQSNLIYVGTPYQETYAETDRKTISLFTFTPESWNEERISLNIARKIQVRLTPEQLIEYVPISNKTKIKVIGDSQIISEIMKLDSVKKMLQSGIKITIEDIKKPVNIKYQTKQLFHQRLRHHFESLNDPELFNDFKNLFPFLK